METTSEFLKEKFSLSYDPFLGLLTPILQQVSNGMHYKFIYDLLETGLDMDSL